MFVVPDIDRYEAWFSGAVKQEVPGMDDGENWAGATLVKSK